MPRSGAGRRRMSRSCCSPTDTSPRGSQTNPNRRSYRSMNMPAWTATDLPGGPSDNTGSFRYFGAPTSGPTMPCGADSAAPAPVDRFGAALTAAAPTLEFDTGPAVSLPVARWYRRADEQDEWLLARSVGATIDLGCGPGRLVAALVARDRAVLGVDASPYAYRLCREAGLPALLADVFMPLPGAGYWDHALIADGNLGIGGVPSALLRRARALVRRGGSVLVETEPPGSGVWSGSARVRNHDEVGRWFRWAQVGLDALPQLAERAGLTVGDSHIVGSSRCFAELVRPY